ncbi:hypothetical protein CDAR_512221 [Caerostris darwini]|uniref:Uncharacterized protein n=1 Tax=Caerostris darwini TaxID=1538125 RepID=A0AAV4WIT9_9ARAC|nr:hypothetical protein CDAR_512221 [Caerostris darwini]
MDERPGRWHLVLRMLLPGDARRKTSLEYRKLVVEFVRDPRTSVPEDSTSSSGRCCPVMRDEGRRRNIENWKTGGGGLIENNKLDVKESDICAVDKFIRSQQIQIS